MTKSIALDVHAGRDNHQLSTAGTLEVYVTTHRGFAIYEFINVIKTFEVDECYCPDPSDYGRIPGRHILVVNRLYRAVRIKTGDETWGMRGYSVDEIKSQINNNLGVQRYVMGIPF
jgi:hypothetical protein